MDCRRPRRRVCAGSRRGHRSRLDRSAETLQFRGLVDDRRSIDEAADQRLKRRIAARLLDRIEFSILQSLYPRRETVAQEMAEPEDMIGSASRISIMVFDPEIRAMRVMVQAVEDIGSLTGRGGERPGVERAVLIRDMGIERHARIDAVFGVHIAAWPQARLDLLG